MRAARQGDFDGLCGVYAVINSLELLGVTGSRSSIHTDLFIQLTHGLGAAALLSAMHDGLEDHELMRAAELAFQWLSATHGVALQITQPFSRRKFTGTRSFLKAVEELVDTPETAVIISFRKPALSHWSVAKSLAGRTIQLRDSGGLSELDVTGFAIERGAHRLRPADTLVVTRQG